MELLLDNPADTSLSFALGNFYLLNERYQEAIDIYEFILRTNPDRADIRCNQGIAYEALELFDDALSQFKQAILANAKLVLAHVHLGQIWIYLGHPHRGVASYQTVMRLDPKHREVNLRLAEIYEQRQDETRLESAYEKALALDPECIQAHCFFGEKNFLIGKTTFSEGKQDEAFHIWAEGYERHPQAYYANRNIVHTRRALVRDFRKQKGLHVALVQFKKNMREDVNNALAFHRLFTHFYFSIERIPELWVAAENLEPQISRWKQSLAREGEHPYPHYCLGVIYSYRGELTRSEEELTRCRDRLVAKKRPSLKLDEILRFIHVVEKIVARMDK